MIKKALLSVWDKEGIVKLGEFLNEQGVELISTGGTQQALESAGLNVTPVEEITEVGSIMNGRVKTLHPKLFGGILIDKTNKIHKGDLETIGGSPIDVVVVNFYPFQQEAVNKKLSIGEAIDFIDIGGPSMIRAAAKNHKNVVPICHPDQYDDFIQVFTFNNGEIPIKKRIEYAQIVFEMTSQYEQVISGYFSNNSEKIPARLNLNLSLKEKLRYGENPHQSAGYYQNNIDNLPWVQHQGKMLSFNNYADIESAVSIVNEFTEPACCIIKHANPCGFGVSDSPLSAYRKAVATDPVSYFGGIVGFNREIDDCTAVELNKSFLECIIAPSFADSVKDIFSSKKNLRILTMDDKSDEGLYSLKSVAGGYLLQEKDRLQGELENLEIVTKRHPEVNEVRAFNLGWKLVSHVKSNGIVFATSDRLVGVGAGQMSRVDSVKLAVQKAGESGLSLEGSIMASDAFFPFPDGIEIAAEVGITAVIQPGGSVKDKDVIETADKLNLCMAFTGTRHFYH